MRSLGLFAPLVTSLRRSGYARHVVHAISRGGSVLALLSGCATAASTTTPMSFTAEYSVAQCASCAEWNEPQPPFRIAGNSYFVGTHGLTAVLITSPSGHVLIDGALPNSAPLIRDNIRALGFDIADVKLILNTHAHFDHSGGIAALQQLSGARVVASPAGAAALRKGNSVPGDPQYGSLLDFARIGTVEEFADGRAITLGSITLTPHVTPAHMPGGTTWSWKSCDGGTCVDIVYADSQSLIPANGFRFSTRPDLALVERGFTTIEQLPCDILLTPHPGASSMWERQASPSGLMDREACKRYAATARAKLAQTLAAERSPH